MEQNLNLVTETKSRRKRKSVIWSLLIASVLTGVMLRVFVVDSFIVKGDSMAPSIINGDYVFVNKLAYRDRGPERGDIVIGEFRGLDEMAAIKRVVGLPKEWVFIENGDIQVSTGRDGEMVVVGRLDSEIHTSSLYEDYQYRLDPFEYFLLGDNGLNSVDSRDLGPVDIYALKGRVWLVFRFKNLSLVDLK